MKGYIAHCADTVDFKDVARIHTVKQTFRCFMYCSYVWGIAIMNNIIHIYLRSIHL